MGNACPSAPIMSILGSPMRGAIYIKTVIARVPRVPAVIAELTLNRLIAFLLHYCALGSWLTPSSLVSSVVPFVRTRAGATVDAHPRHILSLSFRCRRAPEDAWTRTVFGRSTYRVYLFIGD